MKRRKIAEDAAIICIDDEDFLPSPVSKRFQFQPARQPPSLGHISDFEHSQETVVGETKFPLVFDDILSQAAAEGFVESDSDSDSEDLVEDIKEEPTLELRAQSNLLDYSTAPPALPVFPGGKVQGTLDSFFGVKRSASVPTLSKAKKTTRVPWFAKPATPKQSAPFYKRIPETTFLVDDFRFIYQDPPTRYGARWRVPLRSHLFHSL